MAACGSASESCSALLDWPAHLPLALDGSVRTAAKMFKRMQQDVRIAKLNSRPAAHHPIGLPP
jgi:hypothetical protein